MTYTQERYDQLLQHTISKIHELGQTKGREYAPNGDRLENFRNEAKALNLPMETIWHVYANKHWDAITTYIADIRSGQQRPRTEPINSRAHDMLVYLILFLAMCEERENTPRKPPDLNTPVTSLGMTSPPGFRYGT